MQDPARRVRRRLVPGDEQGDRLLDAVLRRELLLVGQLRDVRRPQGRGRVVGGRGADNLGCRLAEYLHVSCRLGAGGAVQASKRTLREATQYISVDAGGGRRIARFRSRLGARERAERVAERDVSNDIQCRRLLTKFEDKETFLFKIYKKYSYEHPHG